MLVIPRKLWLLFTVKQKWQLGGLTFMSVVLAFAQVISVGSIAPFVSVLVNPDSAQSNPLMRTAYELVGVGNNHQFLIILAGVVLAALVIANSFMAVTNWMLVRIGWTLQYRLSSKLLASYLMAKYDAHIETNSAESGKNVLEEMESMVGNIVLPLLRLVVSIIVGSFILVGLLWANPKLTCFAVLILGGGYTVIYLAVRRLLSRCGVQRMTSNTDRFKIVNEAFGGIKEIKVLGREGAMLDQYKEPARRYAGAEVVNQVVLQMPRFGIEILAASLVLILAVFLIGSTGGVIDDTAPLLALYVFAAQRMVPVLQQIYLSASQIRFYEVVLNTIYQQLVESESRGNSPPIPGSSEREDRLSFRRSLELTGLSYTYKRGQRPAVEDITVSIPHRAFVGIIGSTGAGKTTVVDIILGLLEPDQGTMLVDGVAVDGKNLRKWQNNIGYVPQDIYLTDDTISANIAFGIPPEDRNTDHIEHAANVANIHHFVENELPHGYDTVVGERGIRLSGGQRQRIGIARALYHDPDVIILDEATSNLDQGTERNVHQAIEQAAAAKTVIMIAHRLSTTRKCDSLYFLEQGHLVDQGDYNTLFRNNEKFRAMVGTS